MAELGNSGAPFAFVKGVDLNTVGDTAITLLTGNQKWVPRRVTITNASTSLAASSATVGLYTSTGGGGTAIVTAATRTGLTAATKYVDGTIASSDSFTASTVYVRVGVAHGSAATCDVYVYGDYLP